MNTRHITLATFLAVSGFVALAPNAAADEFAFSFSGGGISSSGILTVSPTSTPGLDHITGITGTFTDTNDGISGAITGLYTPVSYTFPPAIVAFTSHNVFSYDDTFWPGGNSPHNCSDYPFFGGELDVYGVAFNVAGGYIGALWSDGNMPVRGLTYAAGDGNATTVLDNPNAGGANQSAPVGVPVALVTNAIPEPDSVLLMGLGLLGACAWLAWKRRLPLY